MISFPSIRTTAIIFQALLFHSTLVLSLPTSRDVPTQQTHTRAADEAARPISKRAVSSAVGGIAGGALGLILLALIIGLGAASIAILGSLEWGEWRGKKKEGKGESEKDMEQGEGRQGREGSAEQRPQPPPVPQKDEAMTNEKARPGRLSSARLTLKSLMPLDFKSGWLPKSNR